jgi:hypothetical protein
MNSAIYVKETGKLTVYGASIQGSGNTTSTDDSSFYDLNAAVLAGSSSTIHLASSTVASSGTGANGVFSTGGGTITVQGGLVKTSRQDSAGIYSTGTIIMTDTTFISSGAEAAVLEGGNSITLNHDSLTSTKADKGG